MRQEWWGIRCLVTVSLEIQSTQLHAWSPQACVRDRQHALKHTKYTHNVSSSGTASHFWIHQVKKSWRFDSFSCCRSSSEDSRQPVHHQHPAEDRLQVWVWTEGRDLSKGLHWIFFTFSYLWTFTLSVNCVDKGYWFHFLYVCPCVNDSQGKGKEMTYWLTGLTGGQYNLPTPPTAWVKTQSCPYLNASPV